MLRDQYSAAKSKISPLHILQYYIILCPASDDQIIILVH